MINLSTQQLRCLVAAHESPTWKVAAADLSITQPALSQAISEVEKRLGINLFYKRGRNAVLTAEGLPVYEYARSVVNLSTDLDAWIKGLQDANTGALGLGLIDVAATIHFGDKISEFMESKSRAEISLRVASSGDLKRALIDGDIAAAILVDYDTADFDTSELISETIAVYSPKTDSVTRPSQEQWVSFPQGSHTRRLVSAALAKKNSTFKVVAESHQPEVLKQMVRMGIGSAALPKAQAEMGSNSLAKYHNYDLCKRSLVLATRKKASHNPLLDELVEVLTN